MPISKEYYCPVCNSLWDLELCVSCGHADIELIQLPEKFRKKSYKEETHDFYKTEKRNRRKK